MHDEEASVLTARERDVLVQMAQGLRVKEIARVLSISDLTVRKHRSNMLRKLAKGNAAELVAYAQAHGLVQRLRDPPGCLA
jgi:DNA-binding NarL/FixJ family response regulator